jgi:hypothetical protein
VEDDRLRPKVLIPPIKRATDDELVARLQAARSEPPGPAFVVEEQTEAVNHPQHYGGPDNPLEVINVIEHYQLDFHLGNVVKYVLRAGRKGGVIDLRKALWYLEREIEQSGERSSRHSIREAITALEATRWDPKNHDPRRDEVNATAVADVLKILRLSLGER